MEKAKNDKPAHEFHNPDAGHNLEDVLHTAIADAHDLLPPLPEGLDDRGCNRHQADHGGRSK